MRSNGSWTPGPDAGSPGPCQTQPNPTSRSRYEELVGAPEATLQRVCGFLGEAYLPEMLSFYRSKDVLFKNEPWKDTTFAPVTTDYIETWRNRLSSAQISLIEQIVAPEMLELGYSRRRRRPADLLAVIPQLARELATWTRHKRRERQLAAGPAGGRVFRRQLADRQDAATIARTRAHLSARGVTR